MLLRILSLWLLIAAAAMSPSVAADETAWSALVRGGYVVLIRHALTEPGVGDPPTFRLGDCSTQRNLSARGRRDALRLGEEFRRRGVPVAQVLSSRWCRCLDTATLAFGEATPSPMLDSMFNDPGGRRDAQKIKEVLATAAQRPANGNLVMVTHNQNIQALTGVSTASGEAVVATLTQDGRLRPVGRIDLFDR